MTVHPHLLLPRARQGSLEAHEPPNERIVLAVCGISVLVHMEIEQPILGFEELPRDLDAQLAVSRPADGYQESLRTDATLAQMIESFAD